MSNIYKIGDVVPSKILCKRLDELADAVTQGPDCVRREFTMRVPAEIDRDADLVLSESATRIVALEARIKELEEAQRWLPVSESHGDNDTEV